MLIYLDSVIVIYFLDANDQYQQMAAQRLSALRAAGDEIAISDLTRLECRVQPINQSDQRRLAMFDNFFILPDVKRVPLSTAVYDRATEIRAQLAFKTTDAIHLAAAIESGCGRFLTHDRQLAKFTGIPVEILS
jgi:predicted nucleic acid-binding protein